jgi:hypothetical protein
MSGDGIAITDRQRMARLFERAGFGATVGEIDQWTAKGYTAAVDHLLSFPPAGERADDARAQSDEASTPNNASDGFDLSLYQRRWLERMATSPYPLEEKLTLHWHSHFATAFTKVRRPQLMIRQNNMIRRLAGGSFRTLCDQMTADAAMLLWLDGATSHAKAINENYGREFLELFTLGRGHYSQDDVREAARAFTGFTVDGQGKVVFNPARHDAGEKVILGRRGAWGPADVTSIVFDHRAGPGPGEAVASRYVARRLATFLYRPDPEPDVVAAMADAFSSQGFEVKPMVRALLLRPEFTDGPALTPKAPAPIACEAWGSRAPSKAGPGRSPGGWKRSIRPNARSSTRTRSNWWRPRSSPPSAPTSGSTWSLPSCSGAGRRRPTWPRPTRRRSKRSSSRPASSATRRRASSGWPRRWRTVSAARCPLSWKTS